MTAYLSWLPLLPSRAPKHDDVPFLEICSQLKSLESVYPNQSLQCRVRGPSKRLFCTGRDELQPRQRRESRHDADNDDDDNVDVDDDVVAVPYWTGEKRPVAASSPTVGSPAVAPKDNAGFCPAHYFTSLPLAPRASTNTYRAMAATRKRDFRQAKARGRHTVPCTKSVQQRKPSQVNLMVSPVPYPTPSNKYESAG
ncbi:hypothetical protein SODALDRAFT_364248 [Sodiomyces alkalinus F11]|uniref:Uncharacterized protein n=1 Tax=Sodiomyces alkalinus (strain CBS 110278 / VKM F-3762 / F11) TaxID=1314773 RepID=A0A3N2PJQ0_SODAK|nr:hypothetical protein SODALDRAFT_364248 [Sodiomyces alkalinus F11]ROT34739.1 hypothetical protein SODALDRAFT_364248 [Sodiomyces alkalinus F11]